MTSAATKSFAASKHFKDGKEQRTWIMDRGIPTEETLEEMRLSDPSVHYLVDTPKGRLTKLEKALASKDWREVKDDVHVKLLPRDGELYVLARSLPRRAKERTMRRKKLKACRARLQELRERDKLTREFLGLPDSGFGIQLRRPSEMSHQPPIGGPQARSPPLRADPGTIRETRPGSRSALPLTRS